VSATKGANPPSNAALIRQKVVTWAQAIVADPVEMALYVPEALSRRHDRENWPATDPAWQDHLHRWMDAAWPCDCEAEALELWDQVLRELRDKGLAVGRYTYGNYSDGDRGLACAAWAAVRHGQPDVVVETGVARGVTSRFILEAMHRNGCGRLWSIDLPDPFGAHQRDDTAQAVPDTCRARWHYIRGSSRRRMAGLLKVLGQVDLFIHDSLHTARNVTYEMNQIARVLAPSGLMIIDDIEMQDAFNGFASAHDDFHTLRCPAADGKGSFGLARRKPPTVHLGD
jgi:hypothetical protein